MLDLARFISDLWIARWAVLNGIGMTIVISALAIILGSLLGIAVGLALVYGRMIPRFIVRVLVDFVRGTPVFVLVLASFYLLTGIGVQLTAFQAGLFALTIFCSSHVGENLRGALLTCLRVIGLTCMLLAGLYADFGTNTITVARGPPQVHSQVMRLPWRVVTQQQGRSLVLAHQDIQIAIAIEIMDEDIRRLAAKRSRVKFPFAFLLGGRSFPPAMRTNHV